MDIKRLNGITSIIPMQGRLSYEIEETLKAEYTEAEREGLQNIILDFRPMDHIDIEGMSALAKLAVTAARLNIVTCTYQLSKRYREILQTCGLSEQYPDYETIRKNIIMLSEPENTFMEKIEQPEGKQDDAGWMPPIDRIILTEKPKGALLKNMAGRSVAGPLQGFGYLWQKTYSLPIQKPKMNPAHLMDEFKAHFPEFQPRYNSFYPTSKGIQPGANVFIDSKTPGGVVSTGVVVLYADSTSFALITPQGHPEAGWVAFVSTEKDGSAMVKIKGLASASDFVYELAFRLAGSKLQENIWKHVLGKFAKHIGIEDTVRMHKVIIDKSVHWKYAGNIRYNAQIRSVPLNLKRRSGSNKEK